MEVWLSGLRHWFAKPATRTSGSKGSNPFTSACCLWYSIEDIRYWPCREFGLTQALGSVAEWFMALSWKGKVRGNPHRRFESCHFRAPVRKTVKRLYSKCSDCLSVRFRPGAPRPSGQIGKGAGLRNQRFCGFDPHLGHTVTLYEGEK